MQKNNGWKDRILEPYYESGTVDGKLYSLTNGISTMGVSITKKCWKIMDGKCLKQ